MNGSAKREGTKKVLVVSTPDIRGVLCVPAETHVIKKLSIPSSEI